MRVRQIMDCRFTLCLTRETVESVARKLIHDNSSHAIVTDERNGYVGVIAARDLLQFGGAEIPVLALIKVIEPVQENGFVADIRVIDGDILPVVNCEKSVVGVINLRSMLEYLPEVAVCSEPKGTLSRKASQLTAKYTINDIVGQSKSVLTLKEQIIAAAKTKSTVIILGETGTGKELAAHAIHRLSNRRHNPFVRVNCAAIPDNLLESELFGYEPGSFTGSAKSGHTGKFEIADGGTIFLDEIGDMPLSLQSKILRVLQEKEIEKIGSRAPISVDVRIIAATHRNLRDLVKEQKFREDLYYRLNVIPIQMPPLRSHLEDIPLLVDYFLTKQAEELGVEKPKVERGFLEALVGYNWPGNVRELANTMELCISLANGTINANHIPEYLYSGQEILPTGAAPAYLRGRAEEAERETILKTLEQYRGNKLKVCDALGISRSSLYNKLKKYDIEV